MTREFTKADRAYLRRENEKYGWNLVELDRDGYAHLLPRSGQLPFRVWRSKDFLVQAFEAPDPNMVRLSVIRTTIRSDGQREGGIGWEDLQRIKGQCGYGDCEAVEIYPRDRDVVNVANMRHLWVLTIGVLPMRCVWRKP